MPKHFSCAKALESRQSKMWTKVKPTRPGWYWWKLMPGDGGFARIVTIRRRGIMSHDLEVVFMGSERIESLEEVDGEFWSEQILPPVSQIH
jgi:hypothetical protein